LLLAEEFSWVNRSRSANPLADIAPAGIVSVSSVTALVTPVNAPGPVVANAVGEAGIVGAPVESRFAESRLFQTVPAVVLDIVT
jgi:hypothetical protein